MKLHFGNKNSRQSTMTSKSVGSWSFHLPDMTASPMASDTKRDAIFQVHNKGILANVTPNHDLVHTKDIFTALIFRYNDANTGFSECASQ